MNILDNQSFFPITGNYISRKIEDITEKLRLNSVALSNLDSDGDVMDDNNFRSLRTERELLEGELLFLKRIIANERIKSPINTNIPITVGHRVYMKIRYPDGESEEISVSIGSPLDIRYLPKDITGTKDHVVASVDAPIVRSVLGKSVNDKSFFTTLDGECVVRIKSIEISSLFDIEL